MDRIRRVAALRPGEPTVSDEFAAAVAYLRLPTAPASLLAAGDVASAILTAVIFVLGIALLPPSVVLFASLLVGMIPAVVIRLGIPTVAALRRTRALGDVTGLVGRLVLRLRVDPALERAVVFAAGSVEGALATSLADHARRAEATPESGLASFATEWRSWDPTLGRACGLVRAAADAPSADRDRQLERALDAARDGTRDRLAAFVSEIRGPATGVYAFGVLLPMALVGVLPAARAAGVSIPLVAFVLWYDVLLPVALLGCSVWLLVRRPVAFPPPDVPSDHPRVPASSRFPFVAGVSAGSVGGAFALFLVPWAVPVVALGCGVGTALVVHYRPTKAVREHVRAVERELPDALSLVGRRVAAGVAVERALVEASDELPGPTGDMLEDAVRVGRKLGVGVEAAFLGEYGALASVPSARVREAGTLFAVAAREGRPAGDVLLAAGDHLDELRRVEARGRRELAAVTDTLASTAALFGPLVGGVTVSMVDRLDAEAVSSLAGGAGLGGESGLAGAYSTPQLGLAVGGYVLLLATILTALSVGLSSGLDRAAVGFRVGVALPTATMAFLVAVVAGDLLL